MKQIIKTLIDSIRQMDSRQADQVCAENSGMELLLKLSELHDKLHDKKMKERENARHWITGKEIEHPALLCVNFDDCKCIKSPEDITDCVMCGKGEMIDNIV